MNRKEINTIAVLIFIVLILILLQKKLRINNSVLDFLLICAIIITGRKYLKVAILLTFLLFIIKTNNCELKEGFADNIDVEPKDTDEDPSDDDSDDDSDDEPKEKEKEKENEPDDDEPKETETETEKEPDDEPDDDEPKETEKENEPDIGTLYEDDCRAKCKKSNNSDTECKEICSVICPNPIKYNHDLKELNKLKSIMKQMEN